MTLDLNRHFELIGGSCAVRGQGQNNKFDLSRIEDNWHVELRPWVFNDPCSSVENALQ